MIIEPSIRSNICINAHPVGTRRFVERQIEEAKALGTFPGPKNVLIIGGSSGYGLSSRIALAFGSDAATINVSYEQPPSGKRTGLAGWWNNIHFQELAAATGNIHKDFIADAFASKTKQDVADYIETTFGKIDLLVYSLASPVRFNEQTGQLVRSAIKSLGDDVVGLTIDVGDLSVRELTVTGGTKEEVEDTVYVMGGSDWQEWVRVLSERKLLNQGFKTISYTYVGGPSTEAIYRGGTLGKAKEDLEEAASIMDRKLKAELSGEALISASKAVVTKASVFIPQMPVYVSCVYDVMLEKGIQESILAHKHRLFKDMVYGNARLADQKNRLRIDAWELSPDVQAAAIDRMRNTPRELLTQLPGAKLFVEEFYQLNGFRIPNVDYSEDVDMEFWSAKQPK
jgi:enoyl-[acyl-carrier protein] reductase/trans-2-enoyl-CoA reductase (NAD+)